MTSRIIGLLTLVAVLTACSEQRADTAPAVEALAPAEVETQISVTGGDITGLVGEDGLKAYHGIPYAAPPIGDLRWAPTAPVIPWQGVRDASVPGPACMQSQGQGGSFYGREGLDMNEDCLTLNVWTRAAHVDEALPVMVWVHGGGLVTGSGSPYPGQLLTSKGVVLVTINYRLNRFGFFAHPQLTAESSRGVSGNQGLRDQLQALRWVQDNIAAFGGDPDNVTVFGESAGSLSASLLQASPLTRGLMHRAIGQSSGAFQPMWYRDQATAYAPSAESDGENFAAALAGKLADDAEPDLAALRALPAETVLQVFQANPALTSNDGLAIVDGEVIPDEVAAIFSQGRQLDVPVIVGSNADEGALFIQIFASQFGEGRAGFLNYAAVTLPEAGDGLAQAYPHDTDAAAQRALVDLFGDVLFAYPMRVWAREMEALNSDAYLYWFTQVPNIDGVGSSGAFHGAELGYVFGNLTMFGAQPRAEDEALSDLMASIWTQFARTGSPNGPGLPHWPAYSAETEAYMELGASTGAKAELRMAPMDLIERSWAARRGTQGR